jgi:hypothetical protein
MIICIQSTRRVRLSSRGDECFTLQTAYADYSRQIVGGVFIGFGIPIVIMGLMIGFPLAVVMSKSRILRWWSTTSVGAVVGALLGFMFSYGAWRGPEPGGVENPFMFTFSPLHWHAPGFTDGITFALADLIGMKGGYERFPQLIETVA